MIEPTYHYNNACQTSQRPCIFSPYGLKRIHNLIATLSGDYEHAQGQMLYQTHSCKTNIRVGMCFKCVEPKLHGKG